MKSKGSIPIPRRLLIIGTGGLAKEIAQLARRIDPGKTQWDTISYVAATSAESGTALPFGSVDYCDAELAKSGLAADAIIAVADPALKKRLAEQYRKLPGLSFPNMIHPSVDVDPKLVVLGKGNVVAQGVVMTCNIVAGDFNLFNKGCLIGHDVIVGSFNAVNPAASVSGGARIGDCCLIAVGARVLDRVSLADRTTVGAGSVLLSDVTEPGHSYFGVPARKIR